MADRPDTIREHILHALSEAVWRVAVAQADRERAKARTP